MTDSAAVAADASLVPLMKPPLARLDGLFGAAPQIRLASVSANGGYLAIEGSVGFGDSKGKADQRLATLLV